MWLCAARILVNDKTTTGIHELYRRCVSTFGSEAPIPTGSQTPECHMTLVMRFWKRVWLDTGPVRSDPFTRNHSVVKHQYLQGDKLQFLYIYIYIHIYIYIDIQRSTTNSDVYQEADSSIYKEADSSMHKDSNSWNRRRNERKLNVLSQPPKASLSFGQGAKLHP